MDAVAESAYGPVNEIAWPMTILSLDSPPLHEPPRTTAMPTPNAATKGFQPSISTSSCPLIAGNKLSGNRLEHRQRSAKPDGQSRLGQRRRPACRARIALKVPCHSGEQNK